MYQPAQLVIWGILEESLQRTVILIQDQDGLVPYDPGDLCHGEFGFLSARGCCELETGGR